MDASGRIEFGRTANGRSRQLSAELYVPQARDEVFEFFADASRLQDSTPPWLHFHVLTPAPIVMHEGTMIDYRLRVHGLPMRWQSRISVWDPPYQFVDEQTRGPYRLWRHTHQFEVQVPARCVATWSSILRRRLAGRSFVRAGGPTEDF